MTLGAYDLNQTASFAEGCTPIRCSHADTVDLPCLVSLSFFAANCALLASLYAPGSRRLHSSPREEVDATKRNARMHTQTHTQTRIRLYAPTRLSVNVAFHHTQSRAVSECTHTHTPSSMHCNARLIVLLFYLSSSVQECSSVQSTALGAADS